MNNEKYDHLKKKIRDEMLVNKANALERNFDLAKQFIGITKDGKVDILIKDKIAQREQIILYLIGKLYAKNGGLSQTDDVDNKELMDELGMKDTSLRPRLMELRYENKIKQVKRGRHKIPTNLVEITLKSIEKKINKSI